MVFSINIKNPTDPQAIRSYRVDSGPDPPFTILQAARATMASPDLFPLVHIGEKTFAANFTNPINSVLKEAGKAFDAKTKVACVFSIGSGTKLVKGLPDSPQPKEYMPMLATIAENCETAHRETASRYGHLGIYHRINVERDPLYITRDEWENGFVHVRRAAANYLQANPESLEQVVNRFVRPIGGPKIQDLSPFYLLSFIYNIITLDQIMRLPVNQCSHHLQHSPVTLLVDPILSKIFSHIINHRSLPVLVDIGQQFSMASVVLERLN